MWLYYSFNKIMKGSGISFQSPTLSQKHARNVCHTAHQYLTKFQQLESNKNKDKCNFHYGAMPMMTSEILKYVNFTKTQKSRYLDKKTLFFLQIKKSLITYQGPFSAKKQFCSGGNL